MHLTRAAKISRIAQTEQSNKVAEFKKKWKDTVGRLTTTKLSSTVVICKMVLR